VRKTPRSRYLYAALVARGTSTTKRAGLRPAYEIAIALSLRPLKRYQRYRISVSRPRVRMRKGGGILLDTVVRNRGNMVDPITGSFAVRGQGVTRTAKVRGPLGILPGKRVRLPAAAVRGLRAGRYRATVTVVQANGGRAGRGTISARFRIAKGGRVTR